MEGLETPISKDRQEVIALLSSVHEYMEQEDHKLSEVVNIAVALLKNIFEEDGKDDIGMIAPCMTNTYAIFTHSEDKEIIAGKEPVQFWANIRDGEDHRILTGLVEMDGQLVPCCDIKNFSKYENWGLVQ